MSEYLVNLNNGKTDEKGQFRLLGKLFTQSGVIESAGLTVAAQASPDMTVKITGSAASDNIVFINSSGDTYHGWNTASYNVTISSNASGVSKTDAVVAYADTAAGISTANNPAGLKFTSVRGASGAPSDAEINTAISSKPFLRLATVVVGNGVSSINSGNITDARIQAWINQPINDASITSAKIKSDAWTSYTPTWSSTGTAVSLGNGSVTGRYIKFGRSITASIVLIIGSTTSFGTGGYNFTLPPFAAANAGVQYHGIGDANHNGGNQYPILGRIVAAGTLISFYTTTGTVVSATAPFTLGTADAIEVTFTYEAAS